jgi:hypothetical protein
MVATAATLIVATGLSSGAAEPTATTNQTQGQTAKVGAPKASEVVPINKKQVVLDRKKASKKPSRGGFSCRNQLARTIHKAGFRGHNIREAWAIAMRESNGRPETLSNGVDHGLFQFNYPAWGDEPWWDTSALLTADYNAKVAFRLSDGGRNWGPWGMRDHAEWNFASYGMWSDWQIQNWIIEPYMRYYNQYPCK